ncbi:MAG: hypothetical protein M1814_005828 [Vezdaea aestivalis]|nr:MAG: hypothetical protein M1814_005828 [Vezdaea aestivalis]
MSFTSHLPTPPNNANQGRAPAIKDADGKTAAAEPGDLELDRRLTRLKLDLLPQSPYILTLPPSSLLDVERSHPDQRFNWTESTPFTELEGEIQYTTFFTRSKYDTIVQARGDWEDKLGAPTTSGIITPNPNLKKISLSAYKSKQAATAASADKRMDIQAPADSAHPNGVTDHPRASMKHTTTISQPEKRSTPALDSPKPSHSSTTAKLTSTARSSQATADDKGRPNMNHKNRGGSSALPELPPLLSPTLPPLIEKKLAKLAEGRESESIADISQLSSQSVSDSAPVPTGKAAVNSKIKKVTPPKVGPPTSKNKPVKSSFFDNLSRPSPHPSSAVPSKASRPNRLVVQLKLSAKAGRKAERILNPTQLGSTSTSTLKKRQHPDSEHPNNGPAPKRAKDLSNRPLTPLDSRPAAPASVPNSRQKSRMASPTNSMASVLGGGGGGPSSATPQGRSTDGPSPAPVHGNGTLRREWNEERDRLATIGRNIKHEAERILQVRANPRPAIDEASRKRGSLVYLDSILHYMLAFAAADMAVVRPSKYRVNDWESIFGLCRAILSQLKDPVLKGLCHQMIFVCRETLQTHLQSRSSTEGDSQSATDHMHRIINNSNEAVSHQTDAIRLFPFNTLLGEFSTVWHGSSDPRSTPRHLLPGSYSGTYTLPLNRSTTVWEAVRYAHAMLKAWAQNEEVDFQSQLKL